MRGKGAGVGVMWCDNTRAIRDSQEYQYLAPPTVGSLPRVRARARTLVTPLQAQCYAKAGAWRAPFHT